MLSPEPNYIGQIKSDCPREHEAPATRLPVYVKVPLPRNCVESDIEDAFCHLKSYLRVRPVFHWLPHRVRNHVRICFLAYWLSA